MDASTLKEMLGKTSDARLAETFCDLGGRREELLAAAGLQAGRAAAEDLSLCFDEADDDVLRSRLKELASQRCRFGYRRLGPAIWPGKGCGSITRSCIGSTGKNGCPCASVVAANGHLDPAPMAIPQDANLR
jgi:hypothetical protein